MVIGEQGLAALAFGKFAEEYEIEEVVGIAMDCAVYLTFYWVFRVSGWICGGSTDGIFGALFGSLFGLVFATVLAPAIN